MPHYELRNTNPEECYTDFCNDIQGICHDDKYWYVSHGAGSKTADRNYGEIQMVRPGRLGIKNNYTCKKMSDCPIWEKEKRWIFRDKTKVNHRFYKFFYQGRVPVGMKIGEIHIGDIDCYNGFLFVPINGNDDNKNVLAQILVFSTKTFNCIHQEVLYKKTKIFSKN